ncbi:polyamine aminopropyltransferase [Streptomyces sp. I05A-00742]|uniref:polyamine aminopropyltransferase n=1 Tax=Streptomyces sp. I05A-00742 TaxID=2732853 RepID=UPI0014886D18|nr:polyamine aminopropyltransferase [Streptomyces sp. I05A-00742]
MIYRPVPARLPVPAGLGRLLVLITVFVCAACGLVYELELVALASYLIGDSVTQASVVLSVMVFAMGVGSLLAKRLRRRAALGFAAVEAVLALVGGQSAMALYACFAWYGRAWPALVVFSLVIGVLIGAEVPLLMTLIQRVRRQDAGGAVADLFAADYVGALVGGLAFPFLLLPMLGQLTGALVTGAINAVAGGALVLWVFRGDLSTRARRVVTAANVLVLALLALCSVLTGPFERAARHAVYGADIRVAVRTELQELVLTGGGTAGRPLSLFLNGRLRAVGESSRYHEALVRPAMAGPHRRVLVLGGGDGMALREVLRHPDVTGVTVVDPDTAVVRLARSHPGLRRLNRDSYEDARVTVVHSDPFAWLRRISAGQEPYDVVIGDLPGPEGPGGAKLYSQEFYGLTARWLAEGGRAAVHAGSASGSPHDFWTVDATLRSVGLTTEPYRAGAAGEEWGFVLAARDPDGAGLPEVSGAGARGVARPDGAGEPPSTLMHPRYGE